MTPKQILLSRPFHVDDLSFRPQAGELMVSADLRSYIDRANEVLGPDGWQSQIPDVQVAGHLLNVVVEITANLSGEWIRHSDIGSGNIWAMSKGNFKAGVMVPSQEGYNDQKLPQEQFVFDYPEQNGLAMVADELAFHKAYSQAFKRAWVQFGMGRYLYDAKGFKLLNAQRGEKYQDRIARSAIPAKQQMAQDPTYAFWNHVESKGYDLLTVAEHVAAEMGVQDETPWQRRVITILSQ